MLNIHRFSSISIKIQNSFSSKNKRNESSTKVYFDANDLDQVSIHRKEISTKIVYRNYVINHLNRSLFFSSPFGRLVSFIKAFQDKYIELKN